MLHRPIIKRVTEELQFFTIYQHNHKAAVETTQTIYNRWWGNERDSLKLWSYTIASFQEESDTVQLYKQPDMDGCYLNYIDPSSNSPFYCGQGKTYLLCTTSHSNYCTWWRPKTICSQISLSAHCHSFSCHQLGAWKTFYMIIDWPAGRSKKMQNRNGQSMSGSK